MDMVENNVDADYNFEDTTDETKAKAVRLYSLLTSYLRQRPLKLIRHVKSENGFEAWQTLLKEMQLATRARALALLWQLSRIQFAEGKTVSEQLPQFEALVLEYERISSQKYSEDAKVASILLACPLQIPDYNQLGSQAFRKISLVTEPQRTLSFFSPEQFKDYWEQESEVPRAPYPLAEGAFGYVAWSEDEGEEIEELEAQEMFHAVEKMVVAERPQEVELDEVAFSDKMTAKELQMARKERQLAYSAEDFPFSNIFASTEASELQRPSSGEAASRPGTRQSARYREAQQKLLEAKEDLDLEEDNDETILSEYWQDYNEAGSAKKTLSEFEEWQRVLHGRTEAPVAFYIVTWLQPSRRPRAQASTTASDWEDGGLSRLSVEDTDWRISHLGFTRRSDQEEYISDYYQRCRRSIVSRSRQDRSVSVICDKILPRAEALNLSSNFIGQLGIRHFEASLRKITMSPLLELNLQGNRLGTPFGPSVEAADAYERDLCNFVDALSTRTPELRALSLAQNGLGRVNHDLGKALGSMITELKHLRVLDLHWNSFHGLGAYKLIEGIGENRLSGGATLSRVDLSWNRMGMACAKSHNPSKMLAEVLDCMLIANGLRYNNTLFGFHVAGNEAFVDELGFLMPLSDPCRLRLAGIDMKDDQEATGQDVKSAWSASEAASQVFGREVQHPSFPVAEGGGKTIRWDGKRRVSKPKVKPTKSLCAVLMGLGFNLWASKTSKLSAWALALELYPRLMRKPWVILNDARNAFEEALGLHADDLLLVLSQDLETSTSSRASVGLAHVSGNVYLAPTLEDVWLSSEQVLIANLFSHGEQSVGFQNILEPQESEYSMPLAQAFQRSNLEEVTCRAERCWICDRYRPVKIMWTPAISSQLNEDEADGITDGIGWSAALRERKRDQVGFVHAYVSSDDFLRPTCLKRIKSEKQAARFVGYRMVPKLKEALLIIFRVNGMHPESIFEKMLAMDLKFCRIQKFAPDQDERQLKKLMLPIYPKLVSIYRKMSCWSDKHQVMGGQICKQLCSRPSERGDALDLKSHLWGEKEKQLGMLGTKHRFYVRGQTPLEPKEALKVAQATIQFLETAPAKDRAKAWKKCEAAWAAALESTKYQFMETLMRVAEAKYLRSNKTDSLGEAMKLLCNHFDSEMTPIFEEEQQFLDSLFTEEVDFVFKNNLNLLNAAYNIYAGITDVPDNHPYAPDQLRGKRKVTLPDFCELLDDCDLFDQRFLRSHTARVFAMGCMYNVDEVGSCNHMRLNFVEFLVALGAVVFRKESYSPEEFADLLEDLPALYITHSFIALRGGFVPHMATFSR
eukprot:g7509.t1